MMTRILTIFCLAFCTMLRAASLPVSFNTTTHKIAAPLDLWTVNSAEIYNGLGLSGMSLQSPSSVSITGGSITGVAGLAYTANPLSQFGATTSSELAGVLSDETGSGGGFVRATSPTLVTPILGTPSQVNLTSATNLPISTGVSGLGSGVATALATPSSANIFAAVTDETGSGSLVGSASPTFTGTVGAATITATGVVTGSSLTASSTSGTIGWSDALITRKASNNLQIGPADSASPSAQAVSFSSATGASDTGGPNITVKLPASTGTGIGGSMLFQLTPAAGSTSSSQNAYVTALSIRTTGGIQFGNAGIGSAPLFYTYSGSSSGSIDYAGKGLLSYSYANASGDVGLTTSGNSITATSGTVTHHYYSRTFAPTSGTAAFNQIFLQPTINQTGGANGLTRGIYIAPTLTSAPGGFNALDIADGNVVFPKTVTAAGTTGAQTINKITGSVNFAAAATSLVVTDSYVTANSIITATVASNDTTMKSVAVVAGSGSFTIYANAAPTAETRVNFHIFN